MPKRKKGVVEGKTISEESDDRYHYIVTLFADIVGCSEISNHKKLDKYNEFLDDFRKCFEKICEHYKRKKYKEKYPFFKWNVRGDEGCLMIFGSKSDDSLPRDIDIAINIAFELKRIWLFTKNNIQRIGDGLLPVDIGIGIHSGKVFVNKEGNDEYRPEGYAINLAKRIESESRIGKFTHILVSEAARGQLHNLKDEDTYIFDDPFSIAPKGISYDIKVFEIKHHFLYTNWNEEPSEASILYEEIDKEIDYRLMQIMPWTQTMPSKIDIVKMAYDANPTNLWLGQEYIWLVIMNGYKKLCKESKEENKEAIKKEYAPAIEVARRIANSDLRDAGTLAIWGFVEGEQHEYKEELKRYNEALNMPGEHGNIHWYKAIVLSYILYDDPDNNVKNDPDSKIKIKSFYGKEGKTINETLEEYKKALDLKSFNPWIAFDYACELSWWSQVEKEFRKDAIDRLIDAFKLNDDTMDWVKIDEYGKYLKPIIDDPKIKKHLQNR